MNASQQRTFVADIPEDQLDTIEGNFKLLAPAASACRDLLAAARAALGGEQQNGDEQASRVQNIGVGSAYRAAVNQRSLWVRNFPGYYEDTQPERSRMAGGEHGEAAARHLAGQIARWTASPGFSWHNNAVAVDFNIQQGNTLLGTNPSQIPAWRRSWFYQWLTAHASEHQFAPNTHINEPRHGKYQGQAGAGAAGARVSRTEEGGQKAGSQATESVESGSQETGGAEAGDTGKAVGETGGQETGSAESGHQAVAGDSQARGEESDNPETGHE